MTKVMMQQMCKAVSVFGVANRKGVGTVHMSPKRKARKRLCPYLLLCACMFDESAGVTSECLRI